MTTTYSIHENVTIANYDYEITALLVLSAIFIIPICTYVCFHETETYSRLRSENKKVWRHIAYIGVFYVIVMIFCAIARSGYHVYSLNRVGDVSVDCVGDGVCCEVFHQCSEGVANTLDHDIYVFNLEDMKCPSLVDMIQERDTTECDKSIYGCCMLQTACDSYVRLNYPYSIYQEAINYRDVGYVSTYIKKTDINGTNCPADIEYVQEYIGSYYKSYSGHNIFLILLVICIFLTPCCTCQEMIGERVIGQWNVWSEMVDRDILPESIDGESETSALSETHDKKHTETDYDSLP